MICKYFNKETDKDKVVQGCVPCMFDTCDCECGECLPNKPKDQSAIERFREKFIWNQGHRQVIIDEVQVNLEDFLSKELSLAEQRGRKAMLEDVKKTFPDVRAYLDGCQCVSCELKKGNQTLDKI